MADTGTTGDTVVSGASAADEVTFLAGVDENGTVSSNTYWAWFYDSTFHFNPARVYISKWYNDSTGTPIAKTTKAGTAGGVVNYAFDSTVGPQAQASYNASFTLWSDIANVSFKQTSNTTTASVLISNTVEGNGDTGIASNGYVRPGTGVTDLPTQMAPNTKGGQTTVNIYGDDSAFNNFTLAGSGYVGTVTHETGHVLGLGHAGKYNGSTDYSGQIGVYDSQLYSVMSYINPGDTNAPYYSQYPVQATNWGGGSAQTPMMLDIQAAQRYYGVSTSSTFSGGQTYGFNCNIADASKVFYDFSQNQNPIVTLYNSGTGNTLDLSGFSTTCTINLNPGTFSSASANGQLTNNIGIALGTKIDTAIGGSGNNIFTLNADNDVIVGGGGVNTVNFLGPKSEYSIVQKSATSFVVTDNVTGAVDRLNNVQQLVFAAPVCFTTGTRIAVRRDGAMAEVPVESLRIGDLAVTATGDLRPIRWIGTRTVIVAGHPCPSSQWPVRIQAGAFGTDPSGRAVPARELRLSPGHPVLVGADAENEGGVLVPVMCLVNGTTIERTPVDVVDYWHVELDRHDVLLAEGLAAESFFDCGTRVWFGRDDHCLAFDPDFTSSDLTGRCRPVEVEGPAVNAERRRLDMVFADVLAGHCAWGGEVLRLEA